MVKGNNGSQQEAKNADNSTTFCMFIVSVDNVGGNILDFNFISGV